MGLSPTSGNGENLYQHDPGWWTGRETPNLTFENLSIVMTDTKNWLLRRLIIEFNDTVNMLYSSRGWLRNVFHHATETKDTSIACHHVCNWACRMALPFYIIGHITLSIFMDGGNQCIFICQVCIENHHIIPSFHSWGLSVDLNPRSLKWSTSVMPSLSLCCFALSRSNWPHWTSGQQVFHWT